MKNKLKGILFAVFTLVVLFTLSACDTGVVGTKLSVDDDFSGTRVMSFDVVQSDLNKIRTLDGLSLENLSFDSVFGSSIKVTDVTEILQKKCPEQLDMEVKMDGKDATCIFTLEFSNIDEYKQKVSSLIGKKANPQYVPDGSDDAENPASFFTSGITLTEDYSSSDMFGWAVVALKEAYPSLADKIDSRLEIVDDVKDIAFIYNGVTYSTESATGKYDIRPVSTPLSLVTVETTRYGANDYDCTIIFSISANNVNYIGKDKLIKKFFAPLTFGFEDVTTASWKSGENECRYIIEAKQRSLEELNSLLKNVFPGSEITYSDGESDAFTEKGALVEHLDFSGFPCTDDNKANIHLKYIASDETTFEASSSGTVSEDGKVLDIDEKGITAKDVQVTSESRYTVSSISVNTDISIGGKSDVSILICFPAKSSHSAADNSAAYLKKQYANTGLLVESRQIGEKTVSSGTDYAAGTGSEAEYALVLSASGTPQEITEVMSNAFGAENSFIVTEGSKFSILRKNDVRHNISIAELLELAKYEDGITYNFHADVSKIDNVNWVGTDGKSNANVLSGKTRNNNFVENGIGSAAFTMSYTYRQLNIPFIVIGLIAAVAIIGTLVIIFNAVGRKLAKRRLKKSEASQLEAVMAVALATIPEELRGEMSELPPELTRRPQAIIEPKTDDGLDEDYDEPEGVILFASTLKILVISAIVLFFFPYCELKKAGALMNCSLSGWDIFFGKEIYGANMPGISLTILMLVIPVVMLLMLLARRALPKLIIPIIAAAGSLGAITYLLQLPDSIERAISGLDVGSRLTSPSFQMAYTYSIVIYVLLALGCLLLVFTDLAYIIQQRKKLDDEQ